MTNLAWLQSWYLSNCDGDWEHGYGIQIETLDNPGWFVKINLLYTRFATLEMEPIKRKLHENDWVDCSIRDKEFLGAGGPENLDEILQVFRSRVEDLGK